MDSDERYMARALALARRGAGRVHPNPMVGAVLVKQGRIVGEGFHRAFGLPHAEVEALVGAGEQARGSTLYLNLEPCSHWGKTPPCAEAVIRAGIRRVVAAMRDPNPAVAGRGFRRLRRHGIAVRVGVREDEARYLNRAFVTWVTRRRPWVTAKAAVSLDGRSATVTGESQWITGLQARAAGHALRAQADAVAVGIETVRADDPQLTAHGRGRDPVRVIFDSRLRLPATARLLREGARPWVVCTAGASRLRKRRLEARGITVIVVPAERHGRVDLPAALEALAGRGIAHLLVEGGRTLLASMIERRLVDEAVWFVAPLLIGGGRRLREALRLEKVRLTRVGEDFCVAGQVRA